MQKFVEARSVDNRTKVRAFGWLLNGTESNRVSSQSCVNIENESDRMISWYERKMMHSGTGKTLIKHEN